MQPGETKCSWCGQDLQPRRGGSPQRFCSAEHRSLFWSTLRRWGARAVAAGILPSPTSETAIPQRARFPEPPSRPHRSRASADGQQCLSDDFSRLLDGMDEILEKPTIGLLIRLGWLARDRQKDHAAVVQVTRRT